MAVKKWEKGREGERTNKGENITENTAHWAIHAEPE